jgi:Uma2 family endonuclease
MTVMSTAPTFPPPGREMTRTDLERMPDDGRRYELVDGVLIVTPAPRFLHQLFSAGLLTRMTLAVPPQLCVLAAPFDVELAEDTVVQPDLVVARTEDFGEQELSGPPLLAVEILSPSTRSIDLFVKKERLARAGCPRYWIVDADEPSITAWSLVEGQYRHDVTARGEEPFSVTEPFRFEVVPAELITRRDSEG